MTLRSTICWRRSKGRPRLGGESAVAPIPVPVPYHGENSPISIPTQEDEEVPEEEEEDTREEDPSVSVDATEEGAITTVQTSQGQTTAWVSVVDFNGNWSTLHEHEAVINAHASDWLEEAARETRNNLPRWGEVNTSEPPYYGVHPPSRANKQPRDGDKDPSLQYHDNSADLLGLEGGEEDTTSKAVDDSRGQPSRMAESTSTGGTFVRHSDGSRRTSGDQGQDSALQPTSGDRPADTTAAGAITAGEAAEGNNVRDNDVLAVSYYNADNRKFRRREGHGPIRMARKQRIWDDWLSWRDNRRAERNGGRTRPSQRLRRTRKDETKNGKVISPKFVEGEIRRPVPHRHLGKNGYKMFMAHGFKLVDHCQEGATSRLGTTVLHHNR